MRAEAIRRRCSSEESSDSDSELDEQHADGALNEVASEYRVAATGAKVSLASAKQLLFHYCSKLPWDK